METPFAEVFRILISSSSAEAIYLIGLSSGFFHLAHLRKIGKYKLSEETKQLDIVVLTLCFSLLYFLISLLMIGLPLSMAEIPKNQIYYSALMLSLPLAVLNTSVGGSKTIITKIVMQTGKLDSKENFIYFLKFWMLSLTGIALVMTASEVYGLTSYYTMVSLFSVFVIAVVTLVISAVFVSAFFLLWAGLEMTTRFFFRVDDGLGKDTQRTLEGFYDKS